MLDVLRVPSTGLEKGDLISGVCLPQSTGSLGIIDQGETSVEVDLQFVLMAKFDLVTLALENEGLNILCLLAMCTQGNLQST